MTFTIIKSVIVYGFDIIIFYLHVSDFYVLYNF